MGNRRSSSYLQVLTCLQGYPLTSSGPHHTHTPTLNHITAALPHVGYNPLCFYMTVQDVFIFEENHR